MRLLKGISYETPERAQVLNITVDLTGTGKDNCVVRDKLQWRLP
jgi:hypothetical protein